MKIHWSLILTALLAVTTGCYLPISGRVIDAETQQPIEGAVVLAQWTQQHGFGFYYHTVYKIEETETDNNGKFSISGAYSPFVDKPTLVIYKQGYVAWRNDYVFPSFEKRKNYDIWQNGYVYKLERFKDGYSRDKHDSFMSSGIMGASQEKTPKFEAATSYELKAAIQEIEKKKRENSEGAK